MLTHIWFPCCKNCILGWKLHRWCPRFVYLRYHSTTGQIYDSNTAVKKQILAPYRSEWSKCHEHVKGCFHWIDILPCTITKRQECSICTESHAPTHISSNPTTVYDNIESVYITNVLITMIIHNQKYGVQ